MTPSVHLATTCGLLLCLLSPAAVSAQRATASEYGLKAAMLYNLANFVEWPAAAHVDRRSPIVLCILGHDPLGSSLSSTNPLAASSIVVRHLQDDSDVEGCHILYISTSERKGAPAILSTLGDSSVLTVGEMSQFAAGGGMIQFSLDQQRVRFDINPGAATKAGLRISAKLLSMSRIVKD